MNWLKKSASFGLLNFGGLAIGSQFTGPGVQSEWYATLPQAPWTPPGWAFGAAWTLIMIGFSLFMGTLQDNNQSKGWTSLYMVAWLLNVGWNPVFFYLHWILPSFFVLILLWAIIVRMFFKAKSLNLRNRWLLFPYVLWLAVAASLNGYPLVMNP